MADVLSRGTLFPPEIIPGMIDMVKGESALAALSAQKPIAFNGQTEFTFTMDNEVDVVAENGAKSKGGATIAPRTIIPVKVEYSARISDEFLYGSEEYQLDAITAFSEGFARKVARGLDIMAFHGLNPRTGTASAVIGTNHFDALVTQLVTMASGVSPDANVEDAIAMIQGSDENATGMAMAPAFRTALAQMVDSTGRRIYPDLTWGNKPGMMNGLTTVTNNTVSFNGNLDRAIVGDFANSFRWGYAKEIPIELIRYGNPDNDETLGDLKGHNQVMLRGEIYIGWGILVPAAFARILAEA